MSKHVRKILPLLLCLLLMACLLPAAYADLADSPEIEAVRAAITGGQTAYTINSGSAVTLAGELNIPAGFTLALTNGSTMKIAHGACLSNSGILAISENARLNVAGTFVFNDGNGEVSLSSGSVIDVTGTAEINRPIRISDGSVRFIIEDGAVFNYGGFNIPENVEPYTVIQGVDLSVYSIHSNGGADRIYTSNRSDKPIRIEDMKSRSIYTIEFHGVDTYTLTESTEIPVFGNVPARVDMSETTLIVPAGMTLTVNGELTVKELQIENGGTVDVKGTLDADRPVILGRSGQPQGVLPQLIIENGATFTPGSFHIYNNVNAADAVQGIDLSQYSYHKNYDRNNRAIRDDRVYYPSSRAGIEDMSNKALGYIEIRGLDTYMLSTDVEVPVFDETPATVDMSETTLIVPNGITLTVSGKLTVKELQIENGGTVDVKGTLDAGRPVDLGRSGQPQGVLPQLIIENGATFTPGSFHIYNNVNAAEAVQGVDLSQYSYHKNYDRNNRAIRDDRVYYPSSRAGIEDMADKAIGYVEIRGLDTYTLTTDVEIPVFDTTPATVDMRDTKLVVPSGRTLTVNGELKVKELVIQPGGSVALAAGGKLTTSAQSADLTLPAALTTIESEAFSGGAFTSVYIPASVTSIASDAFGTRTDLTIYGTIGSQAQTFARNRFTFVALAPAA